MGRTKKLTFMAVLTALALGIFILEAQIPPIVPIPGIKLGLANIITLAAMLLLGKKEAGAILLVRVIMGSMFAGGPASFLYSAAGALFSYIAMCILVSVIPENHLWLTSAIAALCHNAGQLTVCALIVKTPQIWVYAPLLSISGIITGVFTGISAKYLVRALRKNK